MQAQYDDRRGFLKSTQTKANISLRLNITAVVVIVLSWLLFVTGSIIMVVLDINAASKNTFLIFPHIILCDH